MGRIWLHVWQVSWGGGVFEVNVREIVLSRMGRIRGFSIFQFRLSFLFQMTTPTPFAMPEERLTLPPKKKWLHSGRVDVAVRDLGHDKNSLHAEVASICVCR